VSSDANRPNGLRRSNPAAGGIKVFAVAKPTDAARLRPQGPPTASRPGRKRERHEVQLAFRGADRCLLRQLANLSPFDPTSDAPQMRNVFGHDLAAIDSVSRQTSVPSAATQDLVRCENARFAANVLLINADAQLRTAAEREIMPKIRRDGLWLTVSVRSSM
jgi:hypothetical protein